METTIRTSQEQMGTKINAGLEEMKAMMIWLIRKDGG
jgi:hypothetical protein